MIESIWGSKIHRGRLLRGAGFLTGVSLTVLLAIFIWSLFPSGWVIEQLGVENLLIKALIWLSVPVVVLGGFAAVSYSVGKSFDFEVIQWLKGKLDSGIDRIPVVKIAYQTANDLSLMLDRLAERTGESAVCWIEHTPFKWAPALVINIHEFMGHRMFEVHVALSMQAGAGQGYLVDAALAMNCTMNVQEVMTYWTSGSLLHPTDVQIRDGVLQMIAERNSPLLRIEELAREAYRQGYNSLAEYDEEKGVTPADSGVEFTPISDLAARLINAIVVARELAAVTDKWGRDEIEKVNRLYSELAVLETMVGDEDREKIEGLRQELTSSEEAMSGK